MVGDSSLLSVLDEYRSFLKGLDAWFRSVRVKYGNRMQCGSGCILCCCGVFDVGLPDALIIAAGFHRLSPGIKNDIMRRASAIHFRLLEEAPELEEPFFLNAIPEGRIDSLADRFGSVRCPFLDVDDTCLIYEYRPSACILEGIPMVDALDGPFGDWCALNFTGGIDLDIEKDLCLDYYGIESTIGRITENLRSGIAGFPQEEATLFLPSIAISFESLWKDLVNELE